MSSEFVGKPIKCKGAVVWGPGDPFSIEEVTVDPPRAHEVRIRIVSTGICHSDQHMRSGAHPTSIFPIILGHEGAGIVESIGEGVLGFSPGDHVIPLWFPQCNDCKFCLSSKSNMCNKIKENSRKGLMADGSSRFTCRGKSIFHYCGVSSYCEYTVSADIALVKIDPIAPLDRVCLLGCAIPTGYGGVLNTARVTPGSTVGIWGLGGIGLSAVMGARVAGASKIIGIDLNPDKFPLAQELGCTHVLNPRDLNGSSVEEYLIGLTDGGLDFGIECIGTQATIKQTVQSLHPGWGVAVVIGLMAKGKELALDPYLFLQGRVLKGSYFGGYKSKDAMPGLVRDYLEGKIQMNKLISGWIPLEKINEGFDDLLNGKTIRTIIKF